MKRIGLALLTVGAMSLSSGCNTHTKMYAGTADGYSCQLNTPNKGETLSTFLYVRKGDIDITHITHTDESKNMVYSGIRAEGAIGAVRNCQEALKTSGLFVKKPLE